MNLWNKILATTLLALVACSRAQPESDPALAGAGPTTSEAPWLVEISAEAGIDFVHVSGARGSLLLPEIMGGGVALFDCDGDGDLDAYFVNQGGDPVYYQQPRTELTNRLFLREADGHFVDATAASGLGDAHFGMGVATGDYNNDGLVDIYVSNYGPDRLFKNLGQGRFADVTQAAGIDVPGWSCSVAFFDYDRDGLLDLFVTQYVVMESDQACTNPTGQRDYCGPLSMLPTADVLLRNLGDGTFADVSEQAGITVHEAAGLGVVCDDFNDDGWQDVYVANDAYGNFLWINQGDGTFVDTAQQWGVAYNLHGRAEAGMGVVAEDIDGNGTIDLYMTHLRDETNSLYTNLGDGRGFVDSTGRFGLATSSVPFTGFGVVAFDIELDGDLDLALANGRVALHEVHPATELPAPWNQYAEPNSLLLKRDDGRFELADHRAPAFSLQSEISRGLAVGDIDDDGDLDLLLTNLEGPARLFRNDAPRAGHWLSVDARDERYKRRALGARISLKIDSWSSSRTVRAASGYLSSSDARVHFGVPEGVADTPTLTQSKIWVRWPDGSGETFALPGLDRAVTIVRGRGEGQ